MKNFTRLYIFILIIIALIAGAGCTSDFLDVHPNREPSALLSQIAFTRYPGMPVNLGAAGPTDIDNQPLKYEWEVISYPPNSEFTLIDADTANPVFATDYYPLGGAYYNGAPLPAYFGSYVVKLTITDEYGLTETRNVNIIVKHNPPTALGSLSGSPPAPGDTVVIDGSGSLDPDPDKRNDLSYSWNVFDSPKGTQWQWTTGSFGQGDYIPSPRTDKTVNFTPGTVGLGTNTKGEGVYFIRMSIVDEYGEAAADTIVVETSGNTSPTAAADVLVTDFENNTTTQVEDWDPAKETATPTTISGIFNEGIGPLFTLDATHSDDNLITRNYEQDTLTYNWTITGFSEKICLQIDNEEIEYIEDDILSTQQTFSFRVLDSANFTNELAVNTDFTVNLTVSDGVRTSTLPINFDIDVQADALNTAPTAAVTVKVTNSGSAETTPHTAITVTPPAAIEAAFAGGNGPVITLDGTPSTDVDAADDLFCRWEISGFPGTISLQIAGETRNYIAGDTISFDPSFTFKPTNSSQFNSEGAIATDFVITQKVSDGLVADDLILNFDID